MQTLFELVPEYWLEALGWTVLHSLWQGALIAIVLVALFAFVPRKASVIRYRLATLGLAIMALWAIGTFFTYPTQDISLAENHTVVLDAGEYTISTYTTESWLDLLMASAEQHVMWIAWIWLLGVIALSVRWTGSMLYLQRIKTHPVAVDMREWRRTLHKMSQKLGIHKPVDLMASRLIQAPMVIGHLRPVIMVPVSMLTGLAPNQVEAILAHELAHVKRHDFLINLMISWIEIVFFFHPAYWWLSAIIKDEREHCCDDIAVAYSGNALAYAKALTALEEQRLNQVQLGVSLQGRPNHLLSRIKRIIAPAQYQPNPNTRVLTSLILTLGIFGMAWLSPQQAEAVAPDLTPTTYELVPEVPAPLDEVFPIPLQDVPAPNSHISTTESTPAPKVDRLIQSLSAVPFTLITKVDSPPPTPERLRRMPRVPAPEMPEMPPMPPMPSLELEGLPDYLTEDEAKQAELQRSLESYQKAMHVYQEKMEQWQDKWTEEYGEKMEAYAREMEAYARELESSQEADLEVQERMEKMAAELKEKMQGLEEDEIRELKERAQRELERVKHDQDRLRRDLERSRRERGREMRESMEARERAMLKAQKDRMEAEKHRMDLEREKMKELKKNMQHLEEKLGDQKKMLRKELVKDGLLKNDSQKLNMQISKDKMTVNGKRVSDELREKYVKLLKIDGENYRYQFRDTDRD